MVKKTYTRGVADSRGGKQKGYHVLSFQKMYGYIEGYGNGLIGTDIQYIEDGKKGRTFKLNKNIYKDKKGEYHYYR